MIDFSVYTQAFDKNFKLPQVLLHCFWVGWAGQLKGLKATVNRTGGGLSLKSLSSMHTQWQWPKMVSSRNKPQHTGGTRGMLVKTQTGLQSLLRWNGPRLDQYLKHMEISSECKFIWRVLHRLCRKESNFPVKSYVKYSRVFFKKQPWCVCTRVFVWTRLVQRSVSGLWSWRRQSHVRI